MKCGLCHTCAEQGIVSKLRVAEGDKEARWCDACDQARVYKSHGFAFTGVLSPCPKRYVGNRDCDGIAHVFVFCEGAPRGRRLPLAIDVINHSPTGFEWGYGGSGPAQLALAILCDAVGKEKALMLYQRFKDVVVSGLPHDTWILLETQVRLYLDTIEKSLK